MKKFLFINKNGRQGAPKKGIKIDIVVNENFCKQIRTSRKTHSLPINKIHKFDEEKCSFFALALILNTKKNIFKMIYENAS